MEPARESGTRVYSIQAWQFEQRLAVQFGCGGRGEDTFYEVLSGR